VVTTVTDVRTLPSNISARTDSNLADDAFQLSRLDVGDQVLVLHEGLKGYVFVQGPFVQGWTYRDHLAYLDTDEVDRASVLGENFAVIMSPDLALERAAGPPVTVRMGSTFRIMNETEGGFRIEVPARTAGGEWTATTALVSRDDALKGYLPFTNYHFITQATKWYQKGIRYDAGRFDASEFVRLTYKVFGIEMPRAVEQFSGIGGDRHEFVPGEMSEEEVLVELAALPLGTVIGWDDHVALFVGNHQDTGEPMLMHAVNSYQRLQDSAAYTYALDGIDIAPVSSMYDPQTGKSWLSMISYAITPYAEDTAGFDSVTEYSKVL
jgi:hypothetical protein